MYFTSNWIDASPVYNAEDKLFVVQFIQNILAVS